jgi:Protein of unknown function (DUF1236)
MRRLLILAAAAGMLAGAPAAAQVPSDQPAPRPQSTVNLTVEQGHIIKELVKDLRVESASGNVAISVGEIVPKEIALRPIPPEIGQRVPQVKSHEFFVKDGRIVLVSPKDNRIDAVIE